MIAFGVVVISELDFMHFIFRRNFIRLNPWGLVLEGFRRPKHSERVRSLVNHFCP